MLKGDNHERRYFLELEQELVGVHSRIWGLQIKMEQLQEEELARHLSGAAMDIACALERAAEKSTSLRRVGDLRAYL